MIRPYIKQMAGEFLSHPKTTLVNRNVIHDRVWSRQIHILKQAGHKFCICCTDLPFDRPIGTYKHRLPGRYVWRYVVSDAAGNGASLLRTVFVEQQTTLSSSFVVPAAAGAPGATPASLAADAAANATLIATPGSPLNANYREAIVNATSASASQSRRPARYQGAAWRVSQSPAPTSWGASGTALSFSPRASSRSSDNAPAPRRAYQPISAMVNSCVSVGR